MQASTEALRAALAGRYEVERELGQGGMAAVFLARDLKHHRPVAIKVVKPELAASLGAERFLREIDTAASLTHPHVLPVYDSGEAGGFLYYVMPYVEGESLRDRLAREGPLPLDEALRIGREVADALSYAHAHGVVHRDIKPANILLESGHAVVADFGIARAVTASGAETLTETGLTLGTPAYMSPEQASGSKHLDGRSDLYSLACVLYEMLAGQPPFTGPTAESLVHQHLSVAPRPVTDLRPAVPGWVAMALQRALAKAPADRFNPVAQFAEALAHREADSQPTSVSAAPAPATPAVAGPAPSHRRRRWAVAAGAVIIAAVLGGAIHLTRSLWRPAASVTVGPPRTAIAVLPPQNLSADGPHAYFAGGLHDELLTQLAKVASLKVISRTSVMGYQGTTKPLKQIAGELGVGSVVEGSVQVVDGRLRVNVQLIDAATDQHIWADRYDRTIDDAFAVQSEVAQKIVAAVGAALSSEERGRIAAAPTANGEAYRLYLQGLEHFLRPGYLRQNLEMAQRLLERALALDPAFALAHAALSQVHGLMYWLRYDPSAARATSQRAEAEVAVRLAPDAVEARTAVGLVYYYTREWRRALQEFTGALEISPNDPRLLSRIGYLHRRLGNWDRVQTAFQKAVEFDPRDPSLYYDLGGRSFALMGEYPAALSHLDRALQLSPQYRSAAVFRGWLFIWWHGNFGPLRATLDAFSPETDLGGGAGSVAANRAALLLLERDALGLLRMPAIVAGDVFDSQDFFLPAALYRGWAYQLQHDYPAARTAFEAARRSAQEATRGMLSDWRMHAAIGLALAGLGRQDEARREAEWLRGSDEYLRDANQGTIVARDRAMILAGVGDAADALTEIERLLSRPSYLKPMLLRLDPRWDPIRNHPRFQALLKKYSP